MSYNGEHPLVVQFNLFIVPEQGLLDLVQGVAAPNCQGTRPWSGLRNPPKAVFTSAKLSRSPYLLDLLSCK